MAVDASLAEWLRSAALYASAEDVATIAAWGDRAVQHDIISPFATRADAEAEAARQLAFVAGPLVLDRHIVDGARRDLIGTVVELRGDAYDYRYGIRCFVIAVAEGDGMSTIDVLRRLA